MKKLKEKAQLPQFETKDINGNRIDSKNYSGDKLYLVFFRKAACPFCNMGLRDLINKHEEFKQKGIKIITFFGSSTEEILKYAGKQKAPFPIIPDPKYRVYKQYGIDISYGGMMKTMFNPIKVFKAMGGGFFSLKSTFQDPVLPADFLVDEFQNIAYVHYGKTFDDHLDVSEVLEWKPTKLAPVI